MKIVECVYFADVANIVSEQVSYNIPFQYLITMHELCLSKLFLEMNQIWLVGLI